jgi:hypothetical protein
MLRGSCPRTCRPRFLHWPRGHRALVGGAFMSTGSSWAAVRWSTASCSVRLVARQAAPAPFTEDTSTVSALCISHPFPVRDALVVPLIL